MKTRAASSPTSTRVSTSPPSRLLDMLRTHGIVQFDPTGEKFDPKEHEALLPGPCPGKEPGTVLECSKLGYKIKDRLLRAAEVGSSSPAETTNIHTRPRTALPATSLLYICTCFQD